jgi:hypothetical protein
MRIRRRTTRPLSKQGRLGVPKPSHSPSLGQLNAASPSFDVVGQGKHVISCNRTAPNCFPFQTTTCRRVSHSERNMVTAYPFPVTYGSEQDLLQYHALRRTDDGRVGA